MLKNMLTLCCLCLLLGGAAQDSHEAGFNDGDGAVLPKEWKQNLHESFKPYGTVRIIPDPWGDTKWKKAAEVCGSATKAVDLIHQTWIPASAGDVVVIECIFKTAVGGQGRFGFYGSSEKGFSEYDAKNFTVTSDGWEQRVAIFEIKKPETSRIRAFVCARAGARVVYSNVKIRKLDREQARYYSTLHSRKAFLERTKGINLARGKNVSFHPEPSYALTSAGGTDARDLTDGRFAAGNQIWFEKAAVGFERARNGASIAIDLGKVHSLKKAVIRLQGGRMQDFAVAFPDVLEVWISKDGKNSYLAAKLTKLNSTEAELSDWKKFYYLPESLDNSGVPYVYPFSLDIHADARFVIFRSPVYRLRSMFSDELAVIEADDKDRARPDYNEAYRQKPHFINHGSLMIAPKMDTFYIAEGIYLPNYLYFESQLKENSGKIAYSIDLPEGVTFRDSKAWPAQLRTFAGEERKNGRIIRMFQVPVPLQQFLSLLTYGLGPFYFSTDHAAGIPDAEKYAVFTVWHNGKKALEVRRDIEFLKIPKVLGLKHLDVSLWLEDRYKADAPDYHEVWKTLGFTSDMFFPRSVKDAEKLLPLVLKSKAAGKKIRLELEPTQRLCVRYKDRNTYRCIGSEKIRASVCLAYRGKEYLETVDEIRDILKILPADSVTFDIENWEPQRMNASMEKCTRCKEAKEKAGIASWVEYFEKFQADYVKKYAEAAREGAKLAGRPAPRIGFYAVAPGNTGTNYRCREGLVSFLGKQYLYPKYCEEIQKSYYGRSSIEVHRQMRAVYRKAGNPSILIPWLSGGTGAYYAEPSSYRTEQHILETLMNGAGGVQFFARRSFESPLDYFYLARAFAALAPYEDILMKGSLDEKLAGSNPALLYTVRKLGGKILYLVGNYETQRKADAELSPARVKAVRTLSPFSPAKLENGIVKVRIEPDSFGLYLLEL